MLTLIMLFTIIVTAIGQTDTVTLTNSNSVSSTLRTVTNTLRTRTESATATESWSLSATESLRTSTATESVSLSVGTRTLTHPITVTPVADVVSVSLFITPSAVQFPGDIPFAAESWRHRLATSFVVSPSRVVVYWNPDSGTQNISLSISFTGDCEPCCGCGMFILFYAVIGTVFKGVRQGRRPAQLIDRLLGHPAVPFPPAHNSYVNLERVSNNLCS